MSDQEERVLVRAWEVGQAGAAQRLTDYRARQGQDCFGQPKPDVLQSAFEPGLPGGARYWITVGPPKLEVRFRRIPGGETRCPACLHASVSLQRVEVRGQHEVFEQNLGAHVVMREGDVLLGVVVNSWPELGLADVAVANYAERRSWAGGRPRPGFATCSLCRDAQKLKLPTFWLSEERAKACHLWSQEIALLTAGVPLLDPPGSARGAWRLSAWDDARGVPAATQGAYARSVGCTLPSVAMLARAALSESGLPTNPWSVGQLITNAFCERTSDGWLWGGQLYRPGWPLAQRDERADSRARDSHRGEVVFRLALGL